VKGSRGGRREGDPHAPWDPTLGACGVMGYMGDPQAGWDRGSQAEGGGVAGRRGSA